MCMVEVVCIYCRHYVKRNVLPKVETMEVLLVLGR